jgi:hypothetical protein
MSKCEHALRENESAAIGNALTALALAPVPVLVAILRSVAGG